MPTTREAPRCASGDGIVPRPAAYVEDALALHRLAAFNGLLVAQAHALAEELVDEAVEDSVLVAVDGVEVVGILMEERLGTVRRHMN